MQDEVGFKVDQISRRLTPKPGLVNSKAAVSGG
jgi:hypothetical protein